MLTFAVFVLCTSVVFAKQAGQRTFDVPRLGNIAIDGNPADWADQGFRVDVLADLNGKFRAPNQLDGRFRLGWNQQGLLVLVSVKDDSVAESDDISRLWQADCVELYLADKRGGKNMVQAIVAGGVDTRFPELRYYMYDHRKDESLKKVAANITAARTRTKGGYVMEALMPWDAVGITPAIGVEAAFQLFVNDFSPTDGVTYLVWYPATGTFADSTRAHAIRLAEKPSSPALAAGRAYYDGLRCTRAIVTASPELAGKAVSARVDGKEIARGVLSEQNGRAVANMRAEIPAPGVEWKTVSLLLGGKTIDTVSLPDLAQLRTTQASRLRFNFRPFCFSGTRLPDGDFEDPVQAENIYGPYSLGFSYYDADFKPVTTAEKPGRYGAIVEIRPANGAPIKRFYPLFRFAESVDWDRVKMQVKTELPKELGVNPAAVAEQTAALGEFVKWEVVDSFERNPSSAMLMAWLNEVTPGTPATDRTSAYAANNRWMHDLKKATGTLTPLQYYVRMPEGAITGSGQKLPLIIFLDGSGSRGQDVSARANGPIPDYIKTHKDFPFIYVAPQCPAASWWNDLIPELDDVFAEVLAKYPVDTDRIYLTGLSMGGFGSWCWSCEHPERFAAVAPICGGGDPRDAARIKDTPIWNFHGAKDWTVPIQLSNDMVDALKKLDARVRFTVYPEADHNSWDQTYSRDDLYSWMLAQKLGQPTMARVSEEAK
jgi:hypothetical protein